jgi:hypothetical protein
MNQQQINAEIAALKEVKPRVRQFSAFGDDHHRAIDAQITVLEDGMDEVGVCDGAEDAEESDNVLEAGLDAVRWRDGESEQAPSAEWEELAS